MRHLTTTPTTLEKALPPRPKILDSEIQESFLKGSGPGGQKINKTSSAVQIKHLPTGIVVKSQDTRSREHNRKLARNLLAEKLDQMEKGEGSRMAIKGARMRVRKASADKKARRKYRKLGEGKAGGKEGGGEEGVVGVESGAGEEAMDGEDVDGQAGRAQELPSNSTVSSPGRNWSE
ncbi:hypothetical protein LTR86_000394 [Recurvomyces mirabilis]|nr:hypothetical protein LTR86_000394 [Recurvomyces mirabilis]